MKITVLGGHFEGVYGGLDFAESQDHSAAAIIEVHQPLNPEWDYEKAINAKRLRRELGPDANGADYNVPQYLEWLYTITWLHRYRAGTDIKHQVTPHFQSIISSPEIQENGGIQVAADATTMQRYIVKDLQHGESRLRDTFGVIGVSITTGNTESRGDDGFRNVSKNKLVGLAKHLLAQRRLQINPALEHAELLVEELRNFMPKITAAGNIIYEANTRENAHDDLILAASLALWLASKGREPEFGAPAVLDLSRHVG